MNNEQLTGSDADKGVAEVGVADPSPVDQTPNLKFCGRTERDEQTGKITRDDQPVPSFNYGDGRVELPPADFQKATPVFYHPEAALIASTFPHLYKVIRPK